MNNLYEEELEKHLTSCNKEHLEIFIKILDLLQFKAFDIEEDNEKTYWVNGYYIHQSDISDIIELIKNKLYKQSFLK